MTRYEAVPCPGCGRRMAIRYRGRVTTCKPAAVISPLREASVDLAGSLGTDPRAETPVASRSGPVPASRQPGLVPSAGPG